MEVLIKKQGYLPVFIVCEIIIANFILDLIIVYFYIYLKNSRLKGKKNKNLFLIQVCCFTELKLYGIYDNTQNMYFRKKNLISVNRKFLKKSLE